MKEGDKVYCKNSKGELYKKGKYYRIKEIIFKNGNTFVYIDSEKKMFFTFYLEEGVWNFNDYFSLIRVERRKKLKKLEKLNNRVV